MKMNNNLKGAFVAVTSLFFLWGFITVFVDSLVPRLREVFELDYGTSALLQTAFFLAYGIVAIPAGMIISKLGYKKGIIMGLLIMSVGCVLYVPAATERMFGFFLMAFFTVAAGMTVLQVAANPYVAVLGAEQGASSRLNLAQAFNSLGTAIAPALGALFILSDSILGSEDIDSLTDDAKFVYLDAEAAAVSGPFAVLALVILALAVAFIFIPLPKIIESGKQGSIKQLLRFPQLTFGTLGIFLYVGAEVAIGTFAVSYFVDLNLLDEVVNNPFCAKIIAAVHGDNLDGIDAKGVLGVFVSYYWLGAMVGRFVGTLLTKLIRPSVVLSFFTAGVLLMLGISSFSSGLTAMWALIAVGLFNSIMFPTIFGLSIEGLGNLKAQASGVLCAAIVGGAVISPLFGWTKDVSGSFRVAFLVLVVCYVYIGLYGFWVGKYMNKMKALKHDVKLK